MDEVWFCVSAQRVWASFILAQMSSVTDITERTSRFINFIRHGPWHRTLLHNTRYRSDSGVALLFETFVDVVKNYLSTADVTLRRVRVTIIAVEKR